MADGDETVIRSPAWEWLLVGAGFPVLGGLLGWWLIPAAEWGLSLPWVPWQGPMELMTRIPDTWGRVAVAVAGAVVGLLFAGNAWDERTTVTVGRSRVAVATGDDEQAVDGDQVRAAFLDRDQLVLLGSETQELLRATSDLDRGRVADAFRQHGYSWADADPYVGAYHRWVRGDPDLPDDVDRLLDARARSLAAAEDDDAAELRRRVGAAGYVLRDEGGAQYWRRARPGPSGRGR